MNLDNAEEKMILWRMEESTSALRVFLPLRDKLKSGFTTRR